MPTFFFLLFCLLKTGNNSISKIQQQHVFQKKSEKNKHKHAQLVFLLNKSQQTSIANQPANQPLS